MTQVPARLAVWLMAAIVAIAFILGILHWNNKLYSCFNGRHHYGEWVTIYTVSKLEIRVRAWGCEPADQYDPKVFHKL